MAVIGTNSIRIYHADPYANQNGCMATFASKGIYIWLDLNTFNTTIQQGASTWTDMQFWDFTKVMDSFHKYDNVAGFWIGNEIITSLDGSNSMYSCSSVQKMLRLNSLTSCPYIKAAVTDMKAYHAAKGYRDIPIGYSAADIAELRPQLQNYLACSNLNIAIDFFGLNSYEWCGDVNFETSGYANLQKMSEGYNIPIFLSETGCNPGGRTFTDQGAIFGPKMVDTWSGSIIYEWVQEANRYGLVNYPNNKIYSGILIPVQPDYDNIKNKWSKVFPIGAKEASYTPALTAPACPQASGGWQVNGVSYYTGTLDSMILKTKQDVPLPTLASGIVKAAADQVAFTAPPSNYPSSTASVLATSSPVSAIVSMIPISSSLLAPISNTSLSFIVMSTTSETSPNTLPRDHSTTMIRQVSTSTSTTLTSTSTTTTVTSSPSASRDAALHLNVPMLLGGILVSCVWLFG